MRRYGENNDEKFGLDRFSCMSQCKISDTAWRSLDMIIYYTDIQSSQPHEAMHTTNFSYPRGMQHIVLMFITTRHISPSCPKIHNHLISQCYVIPHNLVISSWLAGTNISKKYFCPGGMPASEWTHSVRAARDNPVADYSAPGINTTRRTAYRPRIAVSLFLLPQ
jgi:hypothetical protein